MDELQAQRREDGIRARRMTHLIFPTGALSAACTITSFSIWGLVPSMTTSEFFSDPNGMIVPVVVAAAASTGALVSGFVSVASAASALRLGIRTRFSRRVVRGDETLEVEAADAEQ